MKTFVLVVLGVLALASVSSAQTVCTSNCTVLRNEPFSVAADHNGTDTDGYKLYFNGVLLQTVPVSSLINNVITFPLPSGHGTAGTYQVVVAAYNIDLDKSVAETPSTALTLTVRNRKAPPGQATNVRIVTANR